MTLKNRIGETSLYLIREFHSPKAAKLFFKALLLLTLLKIVLLWSFTSRVMEHHRITLPQSWIGKIFLAPSFVADWNVHIFFGIAMAFLIFAFIVSPHYVTAILYFWLTLNLYVVYLPFANGSDFVIFMLGLWCIPMATRPKLKSDTGSVWQKAIFNTSVILCQLQVVFIYLVSGVDKLQSKAWRSGEAFDYITHLHNMYNPALTGLFDNSLEQLILSWSTILFEMAFAFLVWFKETRLPMLAAGIFFHLFIGIVMSIPDFAGVMMASYLVFLKDSDVQRLQNLFKRSLP